MKKLIYLSLVIIGIISCSAEKTNKVANADLTGTWTWTQTSGGIAGHINETPETTGKNIELTLNPDYTYSLSENGKKISSGSYSLVMKESIYSAEEERFISFNNDFEHPDAVVISGIIRVTDANTLSISDNNYDGIGSRFERKE